MKLLILQQVEQQTLREMGVYHPHPRVCAVGRCLPGLLRWPAAAGRGRRRAIGVHAGQLPRGPPCAPQASVLLLRRHRPGTSAKPAD